MMTTDNFCFLFAKQTNPKPVKQVVNGTVILPPLVFGGDICGWPRHTDQGILKGEVSLFRWPPVWLVWNQLYGNHSYQKSKIDCLSFDICPLLVLVFQGFFLLWPFTVLMKQTRQSILLRCLWWQLIIFVFYFQNSLIQNQSNRWSTVQWYFTL